MKQINYKKLIIPNIPYVFFVYLFDKVGQAVRLAPGADISEKILNITQGFSEAFSNALPSVHPLDLLIGIVGAVVIRLIVYVKGKNAKKYRKGAEYGSARWGNAEDIKPYIDPDFQNNIILTQTERLTMNSRPKQPKYARNKNVVVIGGSGSGKTRFFVKPNLMQLHSSYVLTDPKGTVLIECGKLLQRAGYRIKVLNTINFRKSMHYNPFVYIRSEKDVLKVVNTLIVNTKGEGEKSAEDFWVKAERLLYCALIGYIWYEAPAEEMNFTTLLELINASEAREDDEEYQSPVDLLFADLEERSPDHFAVKQYKKYKLAAGEVNYLSNICKPVFLLQSCVQLANLGGVKLFEPRRKKIEFVHVGGAYHFIRQGNMFLRVVGIAANGKILRVVGGNADVPHSFVQLLLCGGHIQPIAAGVARVKAAAVAYHNRKLFAHVFTLLFLPGIFGDSCRLLLLRGFFALYGVVRHEHTVYFEIVGVLLRDRRGDFRKQAVIRFDTPIQILFHSCLVGENLSILSGNLRLGSAWAVGAHAPCKRP